jgi:DNA-binding ferritin-like protein
MLSPSRGPERLVRLGQWLIALLFAYFLIQVGGSLIADLPLVSGRPPWQRFLDAERVGQLERQLHPLQQRRDQLQAQIDRLAERQQQAGEATIREQTSFDNWRSARSVTEQSEQNPAVIARARQLDQLLRQQEQLRAEGSQLQAQLQQAKADLEAPQQQLQQLRSQARQRAELLSFAIRLLFVGPLLALALWQFRRYRGSDQWPFVWGFLLFGLFAFFVELVPYLPSFGAYIRYGVGALLTLVVGRWLIRWLNAYLLRKQQEQAAPQEQRQRQIRYEKALEALGRHQCPSCERSLPRQEGVLPNYCMHCGLQLQRSCGGCGRQHLACFPYCPSCGLPADAAAMPEEAAVPSASAP